jgi:hypothetical protein
VANGYNIYPVGCSPKGRSIPFVSTVIFDWLVNCQVVDCQVPTMGEAPSADDARKSAPQVTTRAARGLGGRRHGIEPLTRDSPTLEISSIRLRLTIDFYRYQVN